METAMDNDLVSSEEVEIIEPDEIITAEPKLPALKLLISRRKPTEPLRNAPKPPRRRKSPPRIGRPLPKVNVKSTILLDRNPNPKPNNRATPSSKFRKS